jgi:hypothetical protein
MSNDRMLDDAELDVVCGGVGGRGVTGKKEDCQLIPLPFGLTVEINWSTGFAGYVESGPYPINACGG